MGSDIRFLSSRTGGRIAYTVEGSGPPLVVVPPWTSHLQAERRLSGHAAFHGELSRHHTVIRYDRWGCGLSDRARTDFSQGRWCDGDGRWGPDDLLTGEVVRPDDAGSTRCGGSGAPTSTADPR